MRITIPAFKTPICKCGSKMEIYLDAYTRTIQVKCMSCGYKNESFVPFEMRALSLYLSSIEYKACSLSKEG